MFVSTASRRPPVTIEALEDRQLFAIPYHLSLAEQLVTNMTAANNTYAYGTPTVTWTGLSGATAYDNASDCSTFVTSLLEQAYGFTSSQFTTWTGKSLPQAKDLYTAAVDDDGFAGFTQIADLQPGDAMFIKFNAITTDTGHCVFADALPVLVSTSSTQRTYNLTVIDCTADPHANDTRIVDPATGVQETGVGRGTIHVYTDLSGNLIGYSWSTYSDTVEETSSYALTTFAKMPGSTATPWLSTGSLATWNSSAHTLAVTGPTSIIADPGLSLSPYITVTSSSEQLVFLPAAGSILHLGSINLSTGSVANVLGPSNDPVVLDVASGTGDISIDSTSQLDLGYNAMIVRKGSISTIAADVALGDHGGTWTGKGITSSVAAADSTHLTAVAAILNASGLTAVYTSFFGLNASTTDVMVKLTYIGDANLDGTVDGSDYTKIDAGFNGGLTGWLNGDFNYDGVVNGSDYTLIDNAFNIQGSAYTAPAAVLAADSVVNSAGSKTKSAATLFSVTPITAASPAVSVASSSSTGNLFDDIENSIVKRHRSAAI